MKETYEKVLRETEKGVSAVAACKAFGVTSPQGFYSWKMNQNKKGLLGKKTRNRKTPSVTTIQLPQAEGRLIAFYGTPSEVIAAIRNLQ